MTLRTSPDGAADWAGWPEQTRQVPELAAEFTERDRRLAARPHTDGHGPGTMLTTHIATARQAGFEEIDTVWQHFDDRVLVAVR